MRPARGWSTPWAAAGRRAARRARHSTSPGTAPIHPNAALIETFYAAFQRRDAAAMGACYGPTVTFQDPVFTLAGSRARATWRLPRERGKSLRVSMTDIQADAPTAPLPSDGCYTF